MAFIIKQGDTRPQYRVQLLDFFGTPDQAPVDLTDAVSVHMIMRPKGDGVVKFRSPMVFVDRLVGRVAYTWAPTDTDEIGEFDVEFEVLWSDGGKETFPNNDYMTVSVKADLDD